MAGIACHSAGVLGGHNLGEALGLSCVPFMTAAAEIGGVRQFGFGCGGVGRVLSQRSMARFACDMGMLSSLPHCSFFVMARHARVLARVSYWVVSDGLEGPRPVVAKSAETFGDYRASDGEEDAEPSQKDYGRTEQMAGTAKPSAQGHPLSE